MRMTLTGILSVLFGNVSIPSSLVRSLGEEGGLLFFLAAAFDAKGTPRDKLLAFCRDWVLTFDAVAARSPGRGLSGCLEECGGHCLEVELLHALVGKIGNVHPAGPVAF
jgi:hypothetical protein